MKTFSGLQQDSNPWPLRSEEGETPTTGQTLKKISRPINPVARDSRSTLACKSKRENITPVLQANFHINKVS